MHALDPSQGGVVDGQALESLVMLLMQKVEGYRNEVEELKMRHEEMKKYVRSVVEKLERHVERYCLDVGYGEIPLYLLLFSLLVKLCSVAQFYPSSLSSPSEPPDEMALPSPSSEGSNSFIEDDFSTSKDLDMSGPQDMPDYTGYGTQQPSSSPLLMLQGTRWQEQYQDVSRRIHYRDSIVTPAAADSSSLSSGMRMSPSMPSCSQTQNDFSGLRSMSSGSATASRREESMQVPRPPLLSVCSSMTSLGSNMSPSTSSSTIAALPVSSSSTVQSTGGTQQLTPPNFKTVIGVGLPAPITFSASSSSNTSTSANSTIFNTREHSPRILLVEDDEVARTLACKFLEKCGCEFVAVKDGMEAVNQMILGCYDLVLMVSITLVLPSTQILQASLFLFNLPSTCDCKIFLLFLLSLYES
jgi:hypothetical protein